MNHIVRDSIVRFMKYVAAYFTRFFVIQTVMHRYIIICHGVGTNNCWNFSLNQQR